MKPNSAIKRTLEFLYENPGKEYGAIALGLELSLPAASTRTNLAKLFKQGKVLKRGDGLYRSLNSTLEEQEETSA